MHAPLSDQVAAMQTVIQFLGPKQPTTMVGECPPSHWKLWHTVIWRLEKPLQTGSMVQERLKA